MIKPNKLLLPSLCLLTLFIGCGGEGSKIGRVTGTITLDGKPLANAKVQYYPQEGRASYGETNAQGEYDLMCFKKKGAFLGNHKVTVTTEIQAMTGSDVLMAPDEEQDELKEDAPDARRELLPPEYTDRAKTILTATVERGKNVIDFPLESNPPESNPEK